MQLIQDAVVNGIQTLLIVIGGFGGLIYAFNRLASRLGWGKFRTSKKPAEFNPDGL